MSRFVLLSCSQRKRPDSNLLPALDRYDGPAFRVVRRYLRTKPEDTLICAVLSARYGLIPGDYLIPDYDQRLTYQRAQELQPEVLTTLRTMCTAQHYDAICLCMGRTYFAAVDGYTTSIPAGTSITLATGTIGTMLSLLHTWLYGEQTTAAHPTFRHDQAPQTVTLRGVAITLTPAQIIASARQALAEGRGDPGQYHVWCVDIDGQPVSAKWLVSQVTGVPLASFHSDEARHLLRKIGIKVQLIDRSNLEYL